MVSNPSCLLSTSSLYRLVLSTQHLLALLLRLTQHPQQRALTTLALQVCAVYCASDRSPYEELVDSCRWAQARPAAGFTRKLNKRPWSTIRHRPAKAGDKHSVAMEADWLHSRTVSCAWWELVRLERILSDTAHCVYGDVTVCLSHDAAWLWVAGPKQAAVTLTGIGLGDGSPP